MAKRKPTSDRRVPKVRIARPANRPIQIRYTEVNSGREIRVSVQSRDEDAAQRLKREVEAKLLLGHDAAPRTRTRGPSMRWDDFREDIPTPRLVGIGPACVRSNEPEL